MRSIFDQLSFVGLGSPKAVLVSGAGEAMARAPALDMAVASPKANGALQ
jgi:hypothetical protein